MVLVSEATKVKAYLLLAQPMLTSTPWDSLLC